jgi:hypothetical protein
MMASQTKTKETATMLATKPKRGRPAIPEAQRLSEILSLRISKADMRVIQHTAKLEGVTPQKFARQRLTQTERNE